MVSGAVNHQTTFRRLGGLLGGLACAFAVLGPGSAVARSVYILDTGFAKTPGSILLADTKTNALVGAPLTVADHPGHIVFSPDGTKAYIANQLQEGISGELLTMDTRTNQLVGSPIPLPTFPTAMAISPDGARLYLASFPTNSVLVIDLATGQLLPATIPVGKGPEGIAITPDGSKAYVTNRDEKTVSVIDLRAGTPITTVPVKTGPQGVAITPDGRQVYVANGASQSVSVIDTATEAEVPGSPIPVGEGPNQLAVAPDGRRVYVANFSGDSVSVIDTGLLEAVTAIPVIHEPLGIAIAPDGKTGYVTNLVESATSVLNTVANVALAEPIKGGALLVDVGIAPDQAPRAAFRAPPRIRPSVPAVFNGSSSRDPDGSVADFGWAFGDGKRLADGGRSPRHAFARPGKFTVTLTATDDEGCSTGFVFTGQSVSCNGSGVATVSHAVRVSYPTVGVRCPPAAGSRGCLFKLRAVTKRHGGRPQSGPAKVKVKAGKSAKVSLKPNRRFARRLATARNVLVQETARIGGSTRTRFARLKIVG